MENHAGPYWGEDLDSLGVQTAQAASNHGKPFAAPTANVGPSRTCLVPGFLVALAGRQPYQDDFVFVRWPGATCVTWRCRTIPQSHLSTASWCSSIFIASDSLGSEKVESSNQETRIPVRHSGEKFLF